jgi:predicted ferric reductase
MQWQAGQHIFIRIPGIALLDNHPFTVASIMAPDAKEFEYNDLVLVFKPHSGFTRRVFDISRSIPDVAYRAYLDGPYGGLSRKLESFETVLMVAGGSGITPIVAHLQHLALKIRKGEALTKDIRIVWTVKRFGAFFLAPKNSIVARPD